MNVKNFRIDVQPLYDLVVLGKSIHRPDLDERCYALLRARHYTSSDNITMRYVDETGKEVEMKVSDKSDIAIRMKILVLYVQSDRYNYSRSNRDDLKRKLGLDIVSCDYYMPELIDGRNREWLYDNLEDAVNAFIRH